MTLFNYNRETAVKYAKEWSKNPSRFYPDLSLSFGNNVQFLYQCLVNGGFYVNGSAYYDYYDGQTAPVLSKYSSLDKSLVLELGAKKIENESRNYFVNLKSGDLVFVRKQNKGIYGCLAERKNTGSVFYGIDPILYGTELLEGDSYIFYLIPNTGRF